MKLSPRLLAALLLCAAAPAFLIGCKGGDDGAAPSSDGSAPASDNGAAPVAEAPGGGDDAAATAGASEGEMGVGVISSGTAQAPIEQPTPVRPEEASRSRRVLESELPGLVRFTLWRPTFMPEESYTVAPLITEPESGGSSVGLPKVSTGYTVADKDSFAIVLAPAGEGDMPVGDGTPEEITVGGAPAMLYDDGAGKYVLVWEAGDTRIVVRSAGLARDVVLQIAEGLEPVE